MSWGDFAPFGTDSGVVTSFAHDRCVWCGPDDVQGDFSRIFHMAPVETGDAYFVAGAREVRPDEDVFAQRRKLYIGRASLG